MKKILASLILKVVSIIPKGKFANVTYWKSQNNKYLYYCMSETHIENETKFKKVFPEATRISRFEFDTLIFFQPQIQVIEVADEAITAEHNE